MTEQGRGMREQDSWDDAHGKDKRIAELNLEMDLLLYAISHDLRASLRSIDGFSLALIEDYGHSLDEQGNDYLSRVRRAGKKIDACLNALLEMSRQTREDIHLQDVDLGELAREVLNELRNEYPDRTTEVCIAEGLVARFDRGMARTLLKKLLDNALKFTPRTQGGRIELASRPGSGGTVFHVRDNGVGFDMSYAEKRVFGVFQRMHDGEEFKGLGTGLATAKRIINRHGGRIWIESEKGLGTSVFFTQGTG